MKVRVNTYLRVRPVLKSEIENNSYTQCIGVKNKTAYITKDDSAMVLSNNAEIDEKSNKISAFDFDHIFDIDCSQKDVFEKIGVPSVDHMFKGYNVTQFAYGQTATGKTYTMEGPQSSADDEKSRGQTRRILEDIFARQKSMQSKSKVDVVLSVVQLYNEQVYDLLDVDAKKINVRRAADDSVFLQDLNEFKLEDYDEALSHINDAKKRRTTCSTVMNQESSRSHMIVCIKVIIETKQEYQGKVISKSVQFSKINVVDLAGSEAVGQIHSQNSESFKTGVHINKSLLALRSTLSDLVENSMKNTKKFINFRDSKLTYILQDSLQGNCLTSFIGMVTPTQKYAKESRLTMGLISSCNQITRVVKANTVDSKKAAKIRLYGSANIENNTKKKKPTKKSMPWADTKCQFQNVLVSTKMGEINILVDDNFEKNETEKKWLVLLHGNPSDSEEFYAWFPPFKQLGYTTIAIDQPGWGHSPGKQHPSRSQNNLDKGGPVDVVNAVFSALKISKAVIGGYDWGAGICQHFAIKNPAKVDKIISFMPSFNEITNDELKTLSKKTQVLWVKQDQFHNLQAWKKNLNKIPNKTLEVIDQGKAFNQEKRGPAYSNIISLLMRPIYLFLGAVDPTKDAAMVDKKVIKEQEDTKGNKVVAKMNINFAEDLKDADFDDLIMDEDHFTVESVKAFKKSVESFKNDKSKLNEWLISTFLSKNNPGLQTTLRNLPEISPDTLQADPGLLVNLGVWSNLPHGLIKMWNSPRYFLGRQLIAQHTNVCADTGTKSYMLYTQNQNKEKFTTPAGTLSKIDLKNNKMAIKIQTDKNDFYEYETNIQEVLLLNHPQIFTRDSVGKYVLEDGVKVDYTSLTTKAKLLQIAISIKPIVENLDFSDTAEEIIQNQLKAISKIFDCLNLKGFCDELDRTRYVKEDAGKLATYGQVQCHGFSSTIFAFLSPFSDVLGVDVLYRGGCSMGSETPNCGFVSNQVEQHQWVQITLRPSMKSYIVDGWYANATRNANYIGMPVSEAYIKHLYPHPKLLIKNKLRALRDTDFEEEFYMSD